MRPHKKRMRTTVLATRTLAVWGYAVLMLSVVLYVYRFFVFGVNLSLFRMVLLSWTLLLVRDFFLLRVKLLRSYMPFFAILLAIFIVNAFDLYRSHEPVLLGRDVVNHFGNLFLVSLIVLYVNSEDKIDLLISTYIYMSMVPLVSALYTFITGSLPFEGALHEFKSEFVDIPAFTIQYGESLRWAGTFYDPNYYGYYLCTVAIFCFFYLNFVRSRPSIKLILLLSVIALVFTLSRTALIGFAVILSISLLKLRTLRNKVLHSLPAMVLLIGATVVVIIALDAGGVLGERLTDPESVTDRLRFIRNGFEAFERNPILGVGTQGLISSDIPIATAHNVYLSWLAKYGIVGFLVYSAFLFYPLLFLYQAKNRLSRKYQYLLATTLAAVLVMYLAFDFFPLFEFQYVVFGIVYSIALNRIGCRAVRTPDSELKAPLPSL